MMNEIRQPKKADKTKASRFGTSELSKAYYLDRSIFNSFLLMKYF